MSSFMMHLSVVFFTEASNANWVLSGSDALAIKSKGALMSLMHASLMNTNVVWGG